MEENNDGVDRVCLRDLSGNALLWTTCAQAGKFLSLLPSTSQAQMEIQLRQALCTIWDLEISMKTQFDRLDRWLLLSWTCSCEDSGGRKALGT